MPLSVVFDALARLGQLDALLGEMSRRLRKDAIDPLMSPRHVPPPKVWNAAENIASSVSERGTERSP